MEVTLVRHGESLWNAGLSKDLDSALTLKGVSQSIETANFLIDEAKTLGLFEYAFVSPFRRTLQTFYPFRAAVKNRPLAYPKVCEFINKKNGMYDSFAGLRKDQIEAAYPEIDAALTLENGGVWWPEEGEDQNDLRNRAKRISDELREKYGASDFRILIVSHADPIGRIAQALADVPDECGGGAPYTDNCSIWRIKTGKKRDSAELIINNGVSHLSASETKLNISLFGSGHTSGGSEIIPEEKP